MSNRRFEMFTIRQILVRMRQGDTDRGIARTGLMGRKKLSVLRQQAARLSWLDRQSPLPCNEELATFSSVDQTRSPPSGSPPFGITSNALRSGWHETFRPRPSMLPSCASMALRAAIPLSNAWSAGSVRQNHRRSRCASSLPPEKPPKWTLGRSSPGGPAHR